jgi:hypothetical protein
LLQLAIGHAREAARRPVGGTPAEFSSLIASELEKWRNVVPELGIKTD